MAINFPSSPYVGEIYTYGGYSWEWNGTYWETYSPPSTNLTGATSVGVGDSVISNIVDNVLELKTFSGDGITIIDDGDTLTFSASTSPGGPVTSVSASTGLSGSSTTGAVVLVNTLPDKTVTLTGGTNIQVSGTYPNFGINFTGSSSSNFTGGTVSGPTIFQSGLTANTISATTYQNLPQSVSGTGITNYLTKWDPTGNGLIDSDILDDGTNIRLGDVGGVINTNIPGKLSVTGDTILSALTATTISANTYYNLPVSGLTAGTNISITGSNGNYTISFTGASGSGLLYFVSSSTPTATQSGDRWFNTDTGIELVWVDDGDSSQWIQPFSVPGPVSPDVGYYLTTGITSSQTITWDKTYWGISGSSNVNLTLPSTTSKEGYYLIIKDEAGICGNYRIRLTPTSGTIDGNNYVDMNINYMSLTCLVRGGNWYLI